MEIWRRLEDAGRTRLPRDVMALLGRARGSTSTSTAALNMPIRLLSIFAFVLAMAAVSLPAPAQAEDNIYSEDLAAAERGLDRAHSRLANATADSQTAEGELPALRVTADRLRAIADRRQSVADRATGRATERVDDVRQRREEARSQVRRAQRDQARATRTWRDDRARWISTAAGLLAVACGLALAALAAGRGRVGAHRAAAANRSAITLGATVAGYLSGLLALLSWADAWRFSWWPIAAAVIGTCAAVAGTALGWRMSTPLPRRRLVAAVLAPAALLAAGAAVPAAIAASSERPERAQLSADILRLAHDAAADAPMPPSVEALQRRARLLTGRAHAASQRAVDAEAERDRLSELYSDALDRKGKAEHSIEHWSERVENVRDDYDRYQELIDPPEAGDDTDLLDLPDYSDPDYDVPNYDPPAYDLPDLSGPTTEDFGSGSGSVGRCKDGTLSDSIGRPGACSHHGGVG